MDISLLLFTVVALFYVGAVIYLSNQEEAERSYRLLSPNAEPEIEFQPGSSLLRWLLYGLAAVNFVAGLLLLQMGLLGGDMASLPPEMQLPRIDPPAALASFALSVIATWFCIRVVASGSFRQRLQDWIGRRGHYDASSSVHTVAVVLALTLLSLTIIQLVLSGGLSGLAQNVEVEGVSPGGLVFQGVLMVTAAFLGVGLIIRRTPSQSLERLGLRLPTRQDMTWGLGIGLLLYFVLVILATLWALLVPPEQIQQQSAAADQIARAFGTLPLALLLSITSAVSEEILFRGALQPVFGLWVTSIFFALIHMQYTLTPATLIILVVALGLGWLRQRHSTTAAIIAHFAYNFIQLAVAILLTGAAGL